MYKVVSKNLRSVIVGSIDYKIGLWVKPKYGKLFVFKHLKDAKRFRAGGSRIFKCQVTNPEPKARIISWACSSLFRDFWAGNELFYDYLRPAPQGTYVCDSVKLEYEVWNSDRSN